MNGERFSSVLFFGVFVLFVTGSSAGMQSIDSESDSPVISGIRPSEITSSPLPRTFSVDGRGFESGLTVVLKSSSRSTKPLPSHVTATSFQVTAVFSVGSYAISVANRDGESSSPFRFTVKQATGIHFAPRVDYATGARESGPGAGSGSIALADFNGDGKLDIAVSNYASNTIAVFLNKGDGSFGTPVITTVNPLGALGLGAIVAGDFNEDGKMDLIVSTIAGSQSDIVLLGRGDGKFAQGEAVPNTDGFLQAHVVDLNDEKHLDLVAAEGGEMVVALGKGDGTFSPALPLPRGPSEGTYFGFGLGDVMGDRKIDIVAADTISLDGYIVVYPGNGNGTFRAPLWQPSLPPKPWAFPPANPGPDSVSLADFEGKGKLDLLVGYAYGEAGLVPGNGDGTFDMNAESLVYSGPDAGGDTGGGEGITVLAADLDEDGKPDALTADYLGGVFTVVLNDAASISAGTRHSFTIAPGICDIAVGDLNGDGMPDVVLVNDKTNKLSVFLSQSK
jgi:hypothetical protein